MSFRRHARPVIALALLSAACTGPTGGGGDAAAPATTTTPAALFGSLHDTVPPDPGAPLPPTGAASSSSSSPRAASGTTGRGAAAPTTATTGSKRGTSPTTATATPTTVPPGLPPEKCPEPKTCRRYAFSDGTPRRWRAEADGVVRIPYLINPSGSNSLSPEQIEGAIRAAFDTWERAAPTLRFVYRGRTTLQAVPNDGVNVITFNHASIEHTITGGDKQGYVTEFDMLYHPNDWTWAPCQQADNSCTPHGQGTTTGPVTSTPFDLQSIATHAAGHALWLGDMGDETLDRYLTMNPNHTHHPHGSRFWSTLALGDVLGVRALYPCSCPLPPIYDP